MDHDVGMDSIRDARIEACSRMAQTLGRIVASVLEPETVLDEICESIFHHFGYDLVEVWLPVDGGKALELTSVAGRTIDGYLSSRPRIELGSGLGLIAEAFETRTPVMVNDVSADPKFLGMDRFPETSAELVLPMVTAGKAYGAINIESNRSGAFSEEDRVAMGAIAIQAAVTLRNVELFEAEAQRRKEAESLMAASSSVVASLDRTEVLRKILDGLSAVLGAESGSIMLKEGDRVVFISTRGIDADSIENDFPSLEKIHYVQRVLEEKRAIIVADTATDPHWFHVEGHDEVVSWLGVPLVSGGEAIGLLTLDSTRPGFWNEGHLAIASSFADHATIAILNARLYGEAMRRRKEADTLREVSAAMGSSLDLATTLDLVLEGISRVLEFDSGNIMLKRGSRIEIVASRFPEERYRYDTSGDFSVIPSIKLAVEAGIPTLVSDTRLETHWHVEPGSTQEYIRSWIGVPLRSHDEPIGLLNLDHHQPGFYDGHALDLATGFAAHAAISIEHAQLYERAQREIEERKQAEALAREANSEKLDFLSGLVGVIAHEVNTPVGIAITAASHLREAIDTVARDFRDATLRKTDLESFLGAGCETVEMLENNLERVATLVRNFKKIAADQHLEEKRRFNVKEYLDVVILSFKPRLRTLPHKLIVNCPPDIEAETIPSALYQMLANLINNSFLHAFSDDMAGTATVDVRADGATLEIAYRDDGIGIPEETLPLIFKPFFTTARSNGGTGLGLSVVSSLAAKLGGSVGCTSKVGKGTEFVIRLPVIAQGGAQA